MPIMGMFYEGWRPSEVPIKIRHKKEHDIEPEKVVRAVWKVIKLHITEGE